MFLSKPLPTLFEDYPARTRIPAIEITAIAVDSRKVTPGDLFVATSDQIDGHQYISHAIENGAVAALGTEASHDLSVPYILVEASRAALSHLSHPFSALLARTLTPICIPGPARKPSPTHPLHHHLLAAPPQSAPITL